MALDDIIEYIEDKDIESDHNWFLHATNDDVNQIKRILNEGLKCAYLTGLNYSECNGPFYISLLQNNIGSYHYKKRFCEHAKFIITGIRPLSTFVDSNFASIFAKTIIPIRNSMCPGEYQKFLQIDHSKFVGIDYCLSQFLPRLNEEEQKKKIEFLRDVTECIQEVSPSLPIYDLFSSKELNKEKILNLKI